MDSRSNAQHQETLDATDRNKADDLVRLVLDPHASPCVRASQLEAQVRGAVHDATGSVIIGAKVTITDVATNISSSTATDERGYYISNGLHEKQRDIGSSQTVATFPTDLQRSGDFSQTQTFDENGNLAPVTIYNPFAVSADGTRQPFANSVIPPTMIDKVAKNFLSLIPEPNVTGDAGTNYNNYRKNVQSTFSAYQFDARVDHPRCGRPSGIDKRCQ